MDEDLLYEAKKFYKERFNIDPEIVEYVANLDVLLLCVSGYSNQEIADATGLTVNDVILILVRNFGHSGFNVNLGISPILLYRNGTELPNDLYELCKRYGEIESLINEKWI